MINTLNTLQRIVGWLGGRGVRSDDGKNGKNGSYEVKSQEAPAGGGNVGSYFEAARESADRTRIPRQSFVSQRMLGRSLTESVQRETLAALARYVVDNYSTAWLALDLVANYSVPVLPRAASKSVDWNKLAESYFDDWADQADFTRRFDFATLQRVASIAVDVDGDVGFTMDVTHGRPELRMWPTWRIGAGFLGLATGTVGEVDGVLVDANEVVTGYRVYLRERTFQTYSTDEFLHLYEPEQFERYRGYSALRRGMNDLRDAHDIKAFEKLASKIESSLAGVIQGQGELAADWEDPEKESLPKVSTGTAPKSLTVAQLLGGEIPIIDGELKQFGNQRPAGSKLEFIDSLAGWFVAGLGMPPAFYLDMKLTGPNLRAVIGKAQRKFDRRKKLMSRMARWTWLRVIADGIVTGALPAVEGWTRTRFQCQPIISIDLGDQATADREAVAGGLKSRQRYHGDGGEDWQDEQDQIFAEDDYIFAAAAEQSKRTGVGIETILKRHGYEASAPPQPAGVNPAAEQGKTGGP